MSATAPGNVAVGSTDRPAVPALPAWLLAAALGLAPGWVASAGPGDTRQLEGRFLFIDNSLYLSACDGSPLVRVQLVDGYHEIAQIAYPLRDALANAVGARVLGAVERRVQGDGTVREELRVSRLLDTGPRAECNVTGADRPLVATRWITPRDPGAAAGATPARVSRRRFDFTIRADGSIAGSDGCNSFGATYTLERDRRSFALRDARWTVLACDPLTDPGIVFPSGRHQATVSGRRLVLQPGGHTFVADDGNR